MRDSAAGWRKVVGREFQRSGAPKVKERLPVSSLTDGLKSVTDDGRWLMADASSCSIGVMQCSLQPRREYANIKGK